MAPFTTEGCLLDLDLHTTANNFGPNEFRGVVNPFGLFVYKGSNTRWKIVMVNATERKQKQ